MRFTIRQVMIGIAGVGLFLFGVIFASEGPPWLTMLCVWIGGFTIMSPLLWLRAKHIIYCQLVAAVLAVVIGRSASWGLIHGLQSDVFDIIAAPFFALLITSMIFFPIFVLVRSFRPDKWEPAEVLISVVLSFLQFCGLLPLVQ